MICDFQIFDSMNNVCHLGLARKLPALLDCLQECLLLYKVVLHKIGGKSIISNSFYL